MMHSCFAMWGRNTTKAQGKPPCAHGGQEGSQANLHYTDGTFLCYADFDPAFLIGVDNDLSAAQTEYITTYSSNDPYQVPLKLSRHSSPGPETGEATRLDLSIGFLNAVAHTHVETALRDASDQIVFPYTLNISSDNPDTKSTSSPPSNQSSIRQASLSPPTSDCGSIPKPQRVKSLHLRQADIPLPQLVGSSCRHERHSTTSTSCNDCFAQSFIRSPAHILRQTSCSASRAPVPIPRATRLLSCPACPLGFAQERDLSQHIKSHERFACSHFGCDKSYTDKGSLPKHKVSKHPNPGDTRHHCKWCSYESPRRPYVLRHMEKCKFKTQPKCEDNEKDDGIDLSAPDNLNGHNTLSVLT
ncbi:hypothetical protein EK21DRAFT_83677 [Setomelanomma holmii]|uniref:C2H2-type domain-containing protein n=1 Tax=Setomelanomma holmii TaxID=210430 RepID=A0A9P4HNH4_9PLEO|nr:hypothetical protein EK21DRAFT_83677 [Setomelanomma holmii]